MNPVAEGRLDPSSPGGRPVLWAATGRSGGVSTGSFTSLNLAGHVGDDPDRVASNLAAVSSLLGGVPLAVLDACHGGSVSVVSAGGVYSGVDALVSVTPGLGLVALAADCVPIALADRQGTVIAAVHCGWKGLGAGVVSAAISVMRAHGARGIRAVVGPSICAACYPVPLERVSELRSSVHPVVAAASIPTGVSPRINVSGGVVAQLSLLGVTATVVPGCTAELDSLFSYRRDGVTGRQGIAVRM